MDLSLVIVDEIQDCEGCVLDFYSPHNIFTICTLTLHSLTSPSGS